MSRLILQRQGHQGYLNLHALVHPHRQSLRLLPYSRNQNLKITKNITLHLRRIKATKALLSFLFLLIFIDPFLPVDLNLWIFLFLFCQSRPERLALIFFDQCE
jgi:hypothetical protein